jgi:hypothetical protein
MDPGNEEKWEEARENNPGSFPKQAVTVTPYINLKGQCKEVGDHSFPLDQVTPTQLILVQK